MESLFRARGDMHSGEIKQVKEVDSVKAELSLFVAEEVAPDLYKMAEDDAVEIGPFAVRPWALLVLSSRANANPASNDSS